ncbi:MAG: ABC transporter ATP-binding protein [Sedimentisphaerales bacterium]|nr:ABC transporter ATP-binding protein [Sedimentisphaerales bacterium]
MSSTDLEAEMLSCRFADNNYLMKTIVKLKNIRFERNDRTILKDISWTIEQNQHWALLGANGSGKTSLLKIITGYEWPTEGSVQVLGRRYGKCNLRELRKHIGWVSIALENKLPENDSAVDIVASGFDASMGLFRDITENELNLAYDSLAMMNARNCSEQKFGILSQGERQRILIARALINRPSLLILDEPCVGLDPAAKVRFLDDLSRLASCSSAPVIVVVTHHIEEIDSWINFVMVLKNGEVLSSGLKNKVLTTDTLSRALDMDMLVEKEGLKYYIKPL